MQLDAPNDTRAFRPNGLKVERVTSARVEALDISEVRLQTVFAIVRAAGKLATYCDRAEHNEPNDRGAIAAVATDLRTLALTASSAHDLDLQSLYSFRLARIEAKHPAWLATTFDGSQAIGEAKTWRDMQAAQYQHDLFYHPDVTGLAKFDQLRHYTLHLTKLGKLALEAAEGAVVAPTVWDEFLTERLPDIVIFGIKLATVCGDRLPESHISERAA